VRWLALLFVACGPASPAAIPSAAPKPKLEDGAWGKFHSVRHAITLWLPDGHAWKIDDHSKPELVAVHTTGSRLTVRLVQDAGELTNRAKCEAKAVTDKFVQDPRIGLVDEDEGIDKNGWDTHVIVGVETKGAETIGHVMSFSSSIRKCLWIHFETRGDMAEIQDRLLLAQTKILGKLVIDPFGEVPRQTPDVK